MEKLTFFSVLKSNLKCAFCDEKHCHVRYFPKREKTQYYDGRKYVTRCKNDQEDYINNSLKRRLP